MKKIAILVFVFALSFTLTSAFVSLRAGEVDHSNHMMMGGKGPGAAEASSIAYVEANNSMHAGMNIEYTGDADVDFVRGMIPHHQGAVDMCEVQIEYGRNPEILQLCRNIISAQEEEIAFMRKWLEEKEVAQR